MSKAKSDDKKRVRPNKSDKKQQGGEKEKKRLRPGDPYYHAKIDMAEDQIEEYKEAFECFDKDATGIIKVKFLGSVLKILGMDNGQLKDIIRDHKMDGLQSAIMTFEEFLNIMLKHQNAFYSDEVVKDAFKLFDPKDTGLIHESKLADILRTRCTEIDEKEIEALLKDAKIDEDGNIRYNEFAKKISKKKEDITIT